MSLNINQLEIASVNFGNMYNVQNLRQICRILSLIAINLTFFDIDIKSCWNWVYNVYLHKIISKLDDQLVKY